VEKYHFDGCFLLVSSKCNFDVCMDINSSCIEKCPRRMIYFPWDRASRSRTKVRDSLNLLFFMTACRP
jgi:hypothetical protein